ncbi:dTDP-4-dehydrorhamnose reductase [Photobacterium halotolerans]|uniref:dTDP-4-dehydrorhamnose reductase n=1 Tax=Photobacterium halotolerans TaxID=265726 RepID=A0A0F5VI06_9GAMM|nr:dTDP-4-dehydrorhamnose reductase [Photobacterium halotolerans]KKD01472.1 dTDP-4-dehydrorhamnose reductase [Photobacterium halotolerans]
MKVLITGANGQVGQALVNKLQGKAELLAVTREQLDITNEAKVKAQVLAFLPDVIINAAAYTAVDKAEQEQELAHQINAAGPEFLAKAAESINAALLHISTDYVFAGDKQDNYNELDTTNPQGVYGATKLAGELAVAAYCQKHIILRTAWVFYENGTNFVKTMLRLGKERDSLGIVGDQFGGPTYAGDIADALIQIAQKITSGYTTNYGIYHFSGMPHVNWFEFASVIFDAAVKQQVIDKKPQLNAITTADFPTPAKRPANSKLNCEKIQREFGITPSNWQLALDRIEDY